MDTYRKAPRPTVALYISGGAALSGDEDCVRRFGALKRQAVTLCKRVISAGSVAESEGVSGNTIHSIRRMYRLDW